MDTKLNISPLTFIINVNNFRFFLRIDKKMAFLINHYVIFVEFF
jgi:hypothetical protein